MLISLPWRKRSADQLDVNRAQQVLDEDHYDLAEIKGRILEYLAVRELRRARLGEDAIGTKGAILCFAGPPGVGKTSLGRSIARAMGREFIRLSLGGMRDEAEIRGHRRTYIGAMPGSIIQTIRRVGVNNPVFMLDEVDKLSSDFRGWLTANGYSSYDFIRADVPRLRGEAGRVVLLEADRRCIAGVSGAVDRDCAAARRSDCRLVLLRGYRIFSSS